eukprot:scaffold3917_cov377-Prasinococcus_capsulatus_cf.AAC.17
MRQPPKAPPPSSRSSARASKRGDGAQKYLGGDPIFPRPPPGEQSGMLPPQPSRGAAISRTPRRALVDKAPWPWPPPPPSSDAAAAGCGGGGPIRGEALAGGAEQWERERLIRPRGWVGFTSCGGRELQGRLRRPSP